METSGTFISDLRAEVLTHQYFTGMPEVARETADLGIFLDSTVEPLLDYLLSCIDIKKANLADREELAMSVIMKHSLTMMEIMTALKPK